jgi:8-oxo-dGTP diphosphatase
MILLVRHARAGSRHTWDGDDVARPLTKPGRRQAEALVPLLEPYPLARIVSSPYRRCVQTVRPLAAARRLEVAESPVLAEGAPVAEVLRLAAEVAPGGAALCSHGDVMAEVLAHLVETRVLNSSEVAFEKGSTWLLDLEGGRVQRAVYLPAPA